MKSSLNYELDPKISKLFKSSIPYLSLIVFYFFYQFLFHNFIVYGDGDPFINNPDFTLEKIFDGLNYPTGMKFLDNNILVIEKDTGNIKKIITETMKSEIILDLAVANQNERGLLGIDVAKDKNNGDTYVYLFFTESNTDDDGDDYCPKIVTCKKGNDPLGNRLYKYTLKEDKLTSPVLLLDLPAIPGSDHIGGSFTIGPDHNIYIITGDGNKESKTSNIINGSEPDGSGGVLWIKQDGSPVNVNGIFGENYPLNLYYAYGIRNGFGLDFDPVTGNLWDTENGPAYGDEINLVEPGFNSGWKSITGLSDKKNFNQIDLIKFDGKGKYIDPKFTWNVTIGPTAILFLNSTKYGSDYQNDLFVADIHKGNIYHFELNENRTDLILNGNLKDKIANTNDEYSDIVFAGGFTGIADLEIGPDGYLYVLSFYEREKPDRHHYYGDGSIYRILPKNN